jgi:anti-sigma regulatory factor (Ser/Thr protein kinase)
VPDFFVELLPNNAAPGKARAFVHEHWSDHIGEEVLEAVDLCVSEMVTNAIDHAVPPLRLRLSEYECTLRVELEDGNPEPPVVRSQHPMQIRGRGMFLVEALSVAWGVLPAGGGKMVWAEFGS